MLREIKNSLIIMRKKQNFKLSIWRNDFFPKVMELARYLPQMASIQLHQTESVNIIEFAKSEHQCFKI